MRARSPSHMQPSSSGAVWPSVESQLPLDSVPALYPARTSRCKWSPSVALSRTCSRSPVSEGRRFRSQSRSRSHRSPSEGSSRRGSHRESSWRSRCFRSPSRTSSRSGLLLLMEGKAVLALIHLPHLGEQTRTVRRSSPCMILLGLRLPCVPE